MKIVIDDAAIVHFLVAATGHLLLAKSCSQKEEIVAEIEISLAVAVCRQCGRLFGFGRWAADSCSTSQRCSRPPKWILLFRYIWFPAGLVDSGAVFFGAAQAHRTALQDMTVTCVE